ncbi:MAG: DNA polymerase III subunit beta [Marinilabiliales bacterium]|nr:MAG: DNA polymerase III subunit beta [Marinilabiliales bacterium]
MKFVVSSTDLLNHLQAVSRVISTKNTLPILDNFLFNLKDNELVITASDLESTLTTRMDLDNTSGGGLVALPARILTDTLREFPEQPLTFEISEENYSVAITTENGKFNVVGQSGEDFPQYPVLKDDIKVTVKMGADVMLNGISKTIFATADDELRPVMNGIFLDFTPDNMIFVASDAHKLVRYKRFDVKTEEQSSFILPKKPASLLRNILAREKGEVIVEFDDKNALFTLTDYKLVCRLVEGNYPNYSSVIPADNPNKLVIDRLDIINSLKRVSVFSSQASNLVKLELDENQITTSAQDIDFSISAYERLQCQYEGDKMEIGFKSTFLIEILNNLASREVIMELSDPSRAGLLLPAEKESDEEDLLMLLMPMMINV